MKPQFKRQLTESEFERAVVILAGAGFAVDPDSFQGLPTPEMVVWKVGAINQKRRKTVEELLSLAMDDRHAA